MACQTIQVNEPCPRSQYWLPDSLMARPSYAQALQETFDYRNGVAYRNPEIFERIDELEEYCWQMRDREKD